MRVKRRVHGDLLVVDAQAVALRIGVGEEPGLEDGVGGGLDAGDKMGWGEGNLFDFGKVVIRLKSISIDANDMVERFLHCG